MSVSRGLLRTGPAGRNVLIGVGIAVVAPLVWPVVVAVTRSLAKVAVKGFVAVAESLREADLDAREAATRRAAGAGAETTAS